MDWKTSLDWYCSGHSLDHEDVLRLEKQYQSVLSDTDTDNSQEIAPKHICNQTKMTEGSSWIKAVAVVLDRLKPIKNGNSRSFVVNELNRKKDR